MKIKNTNDYLKYRAHILSSEHAELQKSLDDNLIYIEEINKKIIEIKSTVDEGFEMFSPKAAEEKNFNRQEVKELQMRLILIVDENKELKENIRKIEEELRVINELVNRSFVENPGMGKLSENDFHENIVEKEKQNSIENEVRIKKKNHNDILVENLEFCKSIAELDPRRVKIEIENIIDKVKKD